MTESHPAAPRRIELEVEVPATVEQAWEAIATGPGISAWLMPTEIDRKVGGAVTQHHAPDQSSTGTVTAYDPPHRFAYEEPSEEVAPEPGWTTPLATEFLVEARAGGSCVVRVVMSGFGDSDAWDQAIESFAAGWRQVLASLRLYLTHFPGQRAASINAGFVAVGGADGWSRLSQSLGLPHRPEPGGEVATSTAGAPRLAGTVELVRDGMLTLRLAQPATGIAVLGAGGAGEDEFLFMRAQLFGPDATEVAAREQERWQRWFTERLPA